MKSILFIGVLFSANVFAATTANEQFQLRCAVTYSNGKTGSFSGEMSAQGGRARIFSNLQLNEVLRYSDTSIKTLTCQEEPKSGDYQGTPFTNCSHDLKGQTGLDARALNILMPSHDMVSVAISGNVPRSKKTMEYNTQLTTIPQNSVGGYISQRETKVLGNVNCVITKK